MVTDHGLLKNLITLFYRKKCKDPAKHAELKNCYYALCDLCAFSLRPLRFIILLSFLYIHPSFGQTVAPKALSWDQLAAQYQCPEWFSEGKFGIWCHWGPQCVPQSGGGWYARHMYMEDVGGEQFGKNAYPYHLKTFGHPSEFGFKDVINLWKAEKFNADSLLRFFKKNRAKFFVTTANHHDHFDLFASTYHPWNSVNMGPHKDIVGEFEKATRMLKLPFGVTSHDNRFWSWWLTAFGADKYGPKKGIKYDGYLTKADGKEKWWEGYDPADLYGPPPEKRTPELETKMKENYLKRHLELVDKYKPDYIQHFLLQESILRTCVVNTSPIRRVLM